MSGESTLGGSCTTGPGRAADGGGAALVPEVGRADSDSDRPGSDRPGSDTPGTDPSGTDTRAATICGGRIPGAAGALAAAGAEAEPAVCDGTVRLVGRDARAVADGDADGDDAADDADAGTGTAAVAGTGTAAAPAPDAGVAGGSLLVGGGVVASRGFAGADTLGIGTLGTLGAGTAAGADTAAAPVADDGTAAAAGTAATAAPPAAAFTAAAAPSIALWALDRPAWATEFGETATSACAS